MSSAAKKSRSTPADSTKVDPPVAGSPDPAWRFPLRVAVWYFVGLALWLPLGPYYREVLIGVGGAVVRQLPLAGELSVVPYAQPKNDGMTERVDIAVLVRKPTWGVRQGQKQHVLAKAVATFYQPYMATVFLLALFFSTWWLTWPQRLVRAGSALGVLYGFMLACVAIDASYTLSGYTVPAVNGWDWSRTLIALLHFSVTDWPAGVLVVPLVLWALHVWSPRGFRQRRPLGIDDRKLDSAPREL